MRLKAGDICEALRGMLNEDVRVLTEEGDVLAVEEVHYDSEVGFVYLKTVLVEDRD